MFPLSGIYQHFPENTPENIDHDENPNSSNQVQQYSRLAYSNLPTIFEDDGMLLSHLLSQEQLIFAGNSTSHSAQAHTDEISVVASKQAVLDHHQSPSTHENPSKLGFTKKQRAKVQAIISIPRRRTGKKDRHSKISTAQGLRDRRMRLSLQIARKFFDLQDMLGFDKASKTIEWLITKSKTAIKELKAKQRCSSTSEGEVVSKTVEKEDSGDDHDHDESLIRMRKEKKIRKSHKVIARESRDKARARARERTREKNLEKSRQSTTPTTSSSPEAANNNNTNTSVDLGKLRPNNSSLKMGASRFDQEFPGSDQMLDYSISNHIGGVSSGANSEDDFLGFPGNWDINIIDESSKTESFCGITVANAKPVVIGNVRTQNPCAIFTTTLSFDTKEKKPTSSFFPVIATSNAQRENPSSIFVTSSSYRHIVEENPSSVFMATSTISHNYAAEEP